MQFESTFRTGGIHGMREDLIHDALNLLDDDLIGEVEYLRSRKKSRTKQWISWAAMAACMCIVIGSILSGRLPIGIGQNSESADMGNMSNSACGNEEAAESELPIQAEGLINEEKAENESMREVPAFLVEIEEWRGEGFFGTIVGIVDTEIYPVGTPVFVEMPESLKLADTNALYSEGNVVHVQFREKAEKDIVILYAEQIWAAE